MSESARFDYVLDSYALIAHFENETGAEKVREVLTSAAKGDCTVGLSLINVGEIAYLVERERGLPKVHEVLAVIRALPITILPADEPAVFAAAHLKANYRIAYADAFAAAAAQAGHAKLLTGDPEFKALDGREIQIAWLSR